MDRLPVELWLQVFEHLDHRTLVLTVPAVCRRFAAICRKRVVEVDLSLPWLTDDRRRRVPAAALAALARRFQSVGAWWLDTAADPAALAELLRAHPPRAVTLGWVLATPAVLRPLAGRLRKLRLTKMEGIPPVVGELDGLEELELDRRRWHSVIFDSAFTKVPVELGRLRALKRLTLLCCSGLTTLPAPVRGMTQLESLSLCWSDQLFELPPWLGELAALRELRLTGSRGLVALPGSIGALRRLELLELRHCHQLRALPETIRGLSALRTLDLEECVQLEALPSTIGALARLRVLRLSGCQEVAALPASTARLGLEELRLCRCRQLVGSAVIWALRGLRVLSLRQCDNLRTLPPELAQLAQLEQLLLSQNSRFERLPPEVLLLPRLRMVDLWECPRLQEPPAALAARGVVLKGLPLSLTLS